MQNKRKSEEKIGISLIVLVITIIVMIILASTVIIGLNNAGIIALSNKAVFKQNVKSYLADLELYNTKKTVKNPNLDIGTINSTDETLALMISSMKEEDRSNFTVKCGELMYKGENEKQALWSKEIGIPVITGYDEEQNLNSPKLDDGMIPVKYDEANGWVKADKTNTNYDWYKYDDVERKWANVVTVKANGTKTRGYYQTAPVNTPIAMEDITTMFVWIPRYAYSINEGYYKVPDELTEEDEKSNQKLDITFLVGSSNIGEYTNDICAKYPTDYDASSVSVGEKTPKIVHPAFTFGEDELTGIWVAKFEASGSTDTPEDFATYPGNASANITDLTYITILPSVPCWGKIAGHEAVGRILKMDEDENNAYGFNLVDTHLIKNTEWGAVAYLSASKYGKTPLINKNGGFTGYQEKTSTYNTTQGMKASTTHNIYGIYDMNGGTHDMVAALLDNANSSTCWYLSEYFQNGELKKEYEKYFDNYEVSEEEKSNKIQVEDLGDGVTEITQSGISKPTININNTKIYTTKWNEARKRIILKTYNLMSTKKGDAIYEISNGTSYLAVKDNTDYLTFLLETDPNVGGYAKSWNEDAILCSWSGYNFGTRGGTYAQNVDAGIFRLEFKDLGGNAYKGFRPTCVVI